MHAFGPSAALEQGLLGVEICIRCRGVFFNASFGSGS